MIVLTQSQTKIKTFTNIGDYGVELNVENNINEFLARPNIEYKDLKITQTDFGFSNSNRKVLTTYVLIYEEII